MGKILDRLLEQKMGITANQDVELKPLPQNLKREDIAFPSRWLTDEEVEHDLKQILTYDFG